MSNSLLDFIKSRRVVRGLTDQPINRQQLEQILDAGRWAPSGGNRRPYRFVVIQDPLTLRLMRLVSPGMFQRPTALILICADWETIKLNKMPTDYRTIYLDIGTAAENMLLAVHALDLGSGPVTSFSKEAVSVLLNLPERFTPIMFICLGHPAPGHPAPPEYPSRPRKKLTWQDLTYWERFKD
jgi:nitroreductase